MEGIFCDFREIIKGFNLLFSLMFNKLLIEIIEIEELKIVSENDFIKLAKSSWLQKKKTNFIKKYKKKL